MATTLAVALTAGITTLGATPAQAAPVEQATWGLRQSYRNYINGPIASGTTVAADGAVWTAGTGAGKGPFTWPVESATYDGTTETGTVSFAGSVFTGGHDYGNGNLIELELADLTLEIEGDEGTLTADLTYRPFVGATPTTPQPAEETAADQPFATIDLSTQSFTPDAEGAITITNAPAVGVTQAMNLIGWDDFYSAEMPNPALDAFSATFVPDAAPAWEPKVTLSKATVEPTGEAITVTGSGFDPDANVGTRPPLSGQKSGVYVTVGDFNTDWQPSKGTTVAPSSGRRIKQQVWALPEPSYTAMNPNGTDPAIVLLNPDGTFTATLTPKLDYTPVANVGVYVYPGSGATNTAHEIAKPLSFWNPQVSFGSTTGLDPFGDTVSVTGTGFNPDANVGTRPPLSGQKAGFYVVFGDFNTEWQPSKGTTVAPSSGRRIKKQIWVLPQPSYAALNPSGTDPAIALLNPDGTFTLSLPVELNFAAVANLGVYLYPGSGATNAKHELSQPVTFAPTVQVSKTTVKKSGETITVQGRGFDPAANVGTRPPLSGKASGVYATVGDFNTDWQPSKGTTVAPASGRRIKSQVWALPQPSYDEMNPTGTDPAVTLLNPDGSFTADLVAKLDYEPVANVGVYVYPGSGAVNTAHELAVPLTFVARTAAESFVTASRTDFLGAEPTDAAVASGVARLAQLGKTAYLKELSTSDAWLEAIVDGFYVDTLGRPADQGGLTYWKNRIRNGQPVAEVAASFYSSSEYFRGFGNSSVETWITDLYPKLMGRDVDPGGLAYWKGQVASKGRTNVALRLYQSSETARARVQAQYQALLGRSPDAAGLTYWAGKVVTSGDLALAVSLAGSGEYQRRAEARFI